MELAILFQRNQIMAITEDMNHGRAVNTLLRVRDLSCSDVQFPQMSILGTTPEIATFIRELCSRPETHGRHSWVLYTELEASILQIDYQDRVITHQCIVHFDVVGTGTDIPTVYCVCVNLVSRDDLDIWHKRSRAAIGISRIGKIFQHPLCLSRQYWDSCTFVIIVVVPGIRAIRVIGRRSRARTRSSRWCGPGCYP
jgi:hypothetical protein